MRRSWTTILAAAAATAATAVPAQAESHLQAGSPWPERRHAERNTGASPIRARSANAHLGAILLTDAATGAPVPLDRRSATKDGAGAHGNLAGIRLTIPAGTVLPSRIRAYVLAEVFPPAVREL